MIAKLLPDQVAKFWDVIKYALQNSFPPIAGKSEQRINRVLSQLLSEKAQCWISYKIEDNVRTIVAITITTHVYDSLSNAKNLLIYCLYSYGDVIDDDSWKEGLKTLVMFAAETRSDNLIAYSSNKIIIDAINKLGGDTSISFISLPLR